MGDTNQRDWRTPLLIGVAILAVLVTAFHFFNAYIYVQKQGVGNVIEPYRGTLSGTYVACLPHPTPDTCIPGLRMDDNATYAVDFSLSSQLIESPKDGQRMRASGLITPVELLSSDHIRETGAIGVFSVTDSFTIE